MARSLRIEYEGAFYHVTSRGNEKQLIFFSEKDYQKFKSYILRAIEKYEIGMLFGNISYSAVAKANQRFIVEIKRDRIIQDQIKELVSKMSNVKV